MALGSRQLLTPEWAFHHRDAAAGSMRCRVEVCSVSADPGEDWTPADGFAKKATVVEVPVYRGIARVQPNKDWRARKQKYETESVVEHAYRIQLAFDGNELGDGTFPFQGLSKEDRVRVISVDSLRGVSVDTDLMSYTYIIRNILTGSNYWVRTLLCDVILSG